MTDNIENASDRGLRYVSTETKVIFIKAHSVLCQSNGNDSMPEYDYGDGGFCEVWRLT